MSFVSSLEAIFDSPVAQGVHPARSLSKALSVCNEQVVHQKSRRHSWHPSRGPPSTTSYHQSSVSQWLDDDMPLILLAGTVTASSIIWRAWIGIRQNKLWFCFSSKCIQELKYWMRYNRFRLLILSQTKRAGARATTRLTIITNLHHCGWELSELSWN